MLSMSTLSFAGTTHNWDEAKALYNLDIMKGSNANVFTPETAKLDDLLTRTEGVMHVVIK